MASSDAPSLADDEHQLDVYGQALADQVELVGFAWLLRLVELRSPGLTASADIQTTLGAGATQMVNEVRELLSRDLAEQHTGPLDVLRRAVRYPTEVLAAAGTAPVERDGFAVTNFPDDVFGLSPASFAEVDPSLHEPGLVWGAAKAHVHLRRRREAASVPADGDVANDAGAGRIVALSRDLIDQSKIKAAFADVTVVRSPARLVQEATTASLVLVDLAMLSDPAALLAIDARVVGFGSHVDDALLQSAEDAGAEAMPRSVFFRRLEIGDL